MRKIRIHYDSPLDAIIAIAKRFGRYEVQYRMDSEECFDGYTKGVMEDSKDFIEWANDYQHCNALRIELERRLRDAA